MQHNTNLLDTLSLEPTSTTYILDQFSDISWKKTIEVWSKSVCKYVAVVSWTTDLDIVINSDWEHADIQAHILILWSSQHKIRVNCHAHLMHNHAQANIHIISLLPTGSDVDIDGWVDLHKWLSKISGHLLEENILLGESVKIKTLPMLDVHSDDVSASHGCRIERLDAKKMFYLQSRWLSKQEATTLMIEWLVETMVWVLEEDTLSDLDQKTLETIKESSLKYVL